MWFVLFSPGLGGNHLLNVINTDPEMNVNTTEIMKRYQWNVKHAIGMGDDHNFFHTSPGSNHSVKNGHIDKDAIEKRKLFERNNATAMHLFEYLALYHMEDTSLHKHLIIDLPMDQNSLAYQRYLAYHVKNIVPRAVGEAKFVLDDAAMLPGERLYYSKPILEKLIHQLDEFRIPAEIVFSQYGDRLIEWFIDHTPVRPDPDLVRRMQKKYYWDQVEYVEQRHKRFKETSIEYQNNNND